MSDIAMPIRVMRYGVDAALPERRELRAGPVTAVLEEGDLRYVTVAGHEAVRRLYVGVRNQNWDTIPARYTGYSVAEGGDGFRVAFRAEHDDGDVAFAWDGVITGSADGTIDYVLDGVAGRSFLKNRIGFCLLHPTELAGRRATVETPEGTSESVFPDLISPDQPFLDMVSIGHAIRDGIDTRVVIRFEGDLFETEDQRNWTDASYKTYSTPLRLPYPVRVEAGERIRQRVTISVADVSESLGGDGAPSGADITIGTVVTGTLPPIGYGVAGHPGPLSPASVAALRALGPAHIWVAVDLGDEGWVDRLTEATREARALETGLEISVVADAAGGDGLERLAVALGQIKPPIRRVLVFPAVEEPITFPRKDLATTAEVLARAREAFAAAALDVPLGGGARTYFTEFNRASGTLPVEELAVAGYTINPQVHAVDNASLVETLGTQAETVRSARAIAGGIPLAIGPVTLRPPFNPNATGPAPEVGEDDLPPSVDPRQLSLFGAGWTVGSLRHLAGSGADSLTFYETTGWRGLIERSEGLTRRAAFPSRPGRLFPLYHVFAAAAEFAGAPLLPVSVRDQFGVEALALRSDDRVKVLVASFHDAERTIGVSLAGLGKVNVRYLDETTYDAAAADPGFFRGSGGHSVDVIDGMISLMMRPFAVACVDITG